VSTAHKRDRHGTSRGLPPPAQFDLDLLPDSTLLTECETAAAGRFSRNTLQAWRRLPKHALRWTVVGAGYIRYRAGDLKRFLAMGQPRKRKPEPPSQHPPQAAKPPAALPKRRVRRADVKPSRSRAIADESALEPGVSRG
jgi:hypothetical protein